MASGTSSAACGQANTKDPESKQDVKTVVRLDALAKAISATCDKLRTATSFDELETFLDDVRTDIEEEVAQEEERREASRPLPRTAAFLSEFLTDEAVIKRLVDGEPASLKLLLEGGYKKRNRWEDRNIVAAINHNSRDPLGWE